MVFQFLSPVGHKFFCWNCAGIVHGSRIGCQNGGANSDFLHSSGREELDSLPIVLELENTLWFSNSCLQLGTNSFAGIVLELCMDRELVAKMGEPIPIFYTLVRTGKSQTRKQCLFRSRDHHIFTENMVKVALSCDDDKRIVLENGIDTLSLGHYLLEE